MHLKTTVEQLIEEHGLECFLRTTAQVCQDKGAARRLSWPENLIPRMWLVAASKIHATASALFHNPQPTEVES